MIFHTRVSGIPCQCLVYSYEEAIPMRITGTGYGDAEPPEPEVFEFHLMDRKGYPANWLESKLTLNDHDRLLKEYLTL
jgi:hypothetical protein